MSIKQLFCKHIYAMKEDKYLYTTIKYFGGVPGGYPIRKKSTYAIYWECIKCGKQKIDEQIRSEE